MKKILTSMLVMLLMFNFIFCSNIYADQTEPPTTQTEKKETALQNNFMGATDNSATDGTAAAKALADGDTNDDSGGATNSAISGAVGVFMGFVARLLNLPAIEVDFIISHLANNPSKGNVDNGIEEMFWFSIDKTVFNRVALFNINYFDTESTYKISDDVEIAADNNNLAIKNSIVKSYYICRFIALAMSLVVLIYIGIRMAIASVASDQAKYKKMLMSWVESIIILFLMPYIMSALFMFGESLTKIFYGIRNSLLGETVPGSAGTYGVFEVTVRNKLFGRLYSDSGISLATWSLVYWVLLFT